MPSQRWSRLLLIGVILAVIVACCACALFTWFFSDASISPQPSARTPASADSLRLFGGEPDTLDPALVEDSVSAGYVAEIFGGLVNLNSQLEVVPDLAERWELSPDGRTYTFFLRPDARFHSGRQVTAADFKYSLERACNPRTGSAVAAVYLGDIVGANAVLQGTADEISGIRVIDDRQLQITIDSPKAYFLAKLTYSTAFVVNRQNVESNDWPRRPDGTGPFKLQEWTRERIVLQRNEQYYGGAPALAQVVFILQGGSPMSMYENGELDIVWVGPGDIERVRDDDNPLHTELTIVPQLDVQYLAFDVTQPPFDDIKVRQAFALAVDRTRIAEVLSKGTMIPAAGIVPPGMPGYERPALPAYDPSRARQLIAESSYGGVSRLPPVTLAIGGSSGELPPTIEAIVAMYHENLGVEIEVVQDDALLAGRPQFFSMGWIADYPDPEDFLDILFHSQSGLNYSHYSNAEVDGLLEAARVERDATRRTELYLKAEAIIVAQAPWVPLWHSVDYVLTKPYVKGVEYAGAIYPWLRNVYIER